jgi:hypothetical protein
MQENGKQFPVKINCPPERTENETADGKNKRKPKEQKNKTTGKEADPYGDKQGKL